MGDSPRGAWVDFDEAAPAPQPPDAESPTSVPTSEPAHAGEQCDPSYPTLCVPAPPPSPSCSDIPERNFPVVGPDPHGFDRDNYGIGFES